MTDVAEWGANVLNWIELMTRKGVHPNIGIPVPQSVHIHARRLDLLRHTAMVAAQNKFGRTAYDGVRN